MNFYLYNDFVMNKLLDTAPSYREYTVGIPQYTARTYEFRHVDSDLNNSLWQAGTLDLHGYFISDNNYMSMRFSVVRFNSDFTTILEQSPVSAYVALPSYTAPVSVSTSMTWTAGNVTDKLALRVTLWNNRNISGGVTFAFQEATRLGTPITKKGQGLMLMKFL